jgi:hypothetical protein
VNNFYILWGNHILKSVDIRRKGASEYFSTPWDIQVYLDSIEYNPNYECRSPRWVMKKRSAHCFEEFFAAAAIAFSWI